MRVTRHAQVSLVRSPSKYARRMNRERVGGLIRGRRLQLRLTQKDIGEAVELTGAAIGHIETGTNSTSTDTLEKIAQALDAEWEVRLLPKAATGRDPLRTALMDRIAEVIDQLEDRDVRALLGNLEIYATEAAARTRQGQTTT